MGVGLWEKTERERTRRTRWVEDRDGVMVAGVTQANTFGATCEVALDQWAVAL